MLTGLSIMVMAIANHELAKEHFPGTFDLVDEEPQPEPMPCMSEGKGADAGKYCISEVAHKGRHKYRVILPPTQGLN